MSAAPRTMPARLALVPHPNRVGMVVRMKAMAGTVVGGLAVFGGLFALLG